MAMKPDYVHDNPRADLVIVVTRLCAGGCEAPIRYTLRLEAGLSRYAPDLGVEGHHVAYRGGHLCHACERKVEAALRGDEKSDRDRIG